MIYTNNISIAASSVRSFLEPRSETGHDVIGGGIADYYRAKSALYPSPNHRVLTIEQRRQTSGDIFVDLTMRRRSLQPAEYILHVDAETKKESRKSRHPLLRRGEESVIVVESKLAASLSRASDAAGEWTHIFAHLPCDRSPGGFPFLIEVIRRTKSGGNIIAMLPNAVCYAPHYREFRKAIMDLTAIDYIRLHSDFLLQDRHEGKGRESVILHLVRNKPQRDIAVSVSIGNQYNAFAKQREYRQHFEAVVHSNDRERVIHLPTRRLPVQVGTSIGFTDRIDDLDIEINQGHIDPVKQSHKLTHICTNGTTPLLRPEHFRDRYCEWRPDAPGKTNGIRLQPVHDNRYYTSCTLCVVRQYRSCHSYRRIMASELNPEPIGHHRYFVADQNLFLFSEFEDHRPDGLAEGLIAYLNSSAVNEWLRLRYGDAPLTLEMLYELRYPCRESLCQLGERLKAEEKNGLSQTLLDHHVDRLLIC